VELAFVPTSASWNELIQAQFQALRYFTLDGTAHCVSWKGAQNAV
jgi:hypothetical protein